LGFALFKVLTSRGELRSRFAALRVRPAGKAVERPTQKRPGPGPLRRPLLARLAPPRRPRDRRPRLPHRTTPGPKSSHTGLTLRHILLVIVTRLWVGPGSGNGVVGGGCRSRGWSVRGVVEKPCRSCNR
jgi:hypothetical protein